MDWTAALTNWKTWAVPLLAALLVEAGHALADGALDNHDVMLMVGVFLTGLSHVLIPTPGQK